MHEIFNYLAKCFCDNNPIVDPCTKKSEFSTNKVKQAGTTAEDISADSEKWKESPTSENAATERHVNAKWNEEDLSTTKDLSTRGMEDPCMSLETLAEGNSTESTDGTLVLLTGTLCKMQTEPQNSLPLTPRSPIEGEPNRCKQEAADSIATAGCTNRTVEMAEPEVADTDVDRMALLGRDLAERACRVNKGDRMECKGTQLQQTEFYCKETGQHNANANEKVPIAHGVLLEGEWTWCASSEVRDPKGDANASDTATEHVDHPSKSRVTEDTNGVKSEGHRKGMSE